MQLFAFDHEQEVTANCCGWRVSTTYWLATSRTAAEADIKQETSDDKTPHGLCAHCMADLLARKNHEIHGDDSCESDGEIDVYTVVVHPADTTSYVNEVTTSEEKAISQRNAAEKQHGLGTAEVLKHEVEQ